MKKLFRFKYEPCNGTCYAEEDVFYEQLRPMCEQDLQDLISIVVKAHDSLCDNPDYSFGIDLDEQNNVFIGHFRTPHKTDLYTGKTLTECVTNLCNAVLSEKIPQVTGYCNFGNHGTENLADKILKRARAA